MERWPHKGAAGFAEPSPEASGMRSPATEDDGRCDFSLLLWLAIFELLALNFLLQEAVKSSAIRIWGRASEALGSSYFIEINRPFELALAF